MENSEQQQSKKQFPPQEQARQPGIERDMRPAPKDIPDDYRASGKLEGRVAVITGGDSGIGRAVAYLFAREGADIVIGYLNEIEDAEETRAFVEKTGRRCLALPGDVGDPKFCREIILHATSGLGRIDILVNNAAEQHPCDHLSEISPDQLEKTFRTNIFSYFYMAQAALPHLEAGSSIINTTSVTAYRGSPSLIDYSSTKGAIVAFTRSLAMNLASKGIRVNAVAPGPIWTPLIPATFGEEKVSRFGSDTPMKRAGQPAEVAPCYVFLASNDSSYISGQVLHPNGGEVING